MPAKVLDGKAAQAEIKAELTVQVAALRERGVLPGLGTILVGDDPASQNYVRMKHGDCQQVGIASVRIDLPGDASRAQLHEAIEQLNADPAVTGYLIQLPLPDHLDEFEALSLVEPAKDCDGLHPVNLGRLVLGEPGPLPCTPWGIVDLLRRNGIELRGAEVCVIGRGTTVGRPLGLILTRRSENATVTICHTATRDLASHTRRAEIVVAAAGVPGMVTAEMISPGAVLVDVGVSRVAGVTTGDLAPDVWDKAGWVTPNPGGVGPMTRAMLLSNVVQLAQARA